MHLLRLAIVAVGMLAAGLSFPASPFGAAAATITVNPLTVSPTSVAAGGTVTFTAGLTANAKLSAYPVEFSVAAPGGASSTYKLFYLNFVSGKTVTESVTWTAPANAKAGSYTLSVTAFTPNWSSIEGSKSTTFTVSGSSAATPPPATSASAPGPNSAVFSAPFYSCVRNFYVSTTGKDTNAGTVSSPWLTIEHADSTARTGGDCINVAPGTYNAEVLISHGGTGPTATGYVAYRCQTLDGCHVLATGRGHVWGIRQPANYVVIDGFEVDGNNALQKDGIADVCIGSDGATYGTGNSSHHIWVLNNILHHCNLAGLSFNNKEWYYILHNTAYHNAFTSGAQGSGIAFVVMQCIEKGNSSCASGSTYAGGTGTYTPSGEDLTVASPFHNMISDNIVYDNMIASNNPIACGSHTDGNGIILDTSMDETTNKIVYPYQTLVAGNVAYGNGARGIHIFRTSNVTVANNTAYANGVDTCINAYGVGDLSQSGGSNNVWINNVAQSVLTAANPNCGSFCGHNNLPLVAGNAGAIVDTNNIFLNNVFYGGVGTGVMTSGTTGLGLYDNDVKYFSTANNKVNTNPLLSAPASGNFAVKTGSPAINYGKTESYLPATSVTAGACASSLSTCP